MKIQKIAYDMWENMGWLFAEYVFLDQRFDFDPHSKKTGLIEISGIDLFGKIKN